MITFNTLCFIRLSEWIYEWFLLHGSELILLKQHSLKVQSSLDSLEISNVAALSNVAQNCIQKTIIFTYCPAACVSLHLISNIEGIDVSKS